MSFCAVRFSIVSHRERDQGYNADKFVKQFGQFVYQNSFHMRQFGWQLSVAINTVTLGLLVILFFIIIFLFFDVAL